MRNNYSAFHAYTIDRSVVVALREAAREENSAFAVTLAECAAADPWGTTRRTVGFAPILEGQPHLFGEVESNVGTYIFNVEFRTRVLPRAKVKEVAKAHIAGIESQFGKLTKDEKSQHFEAIEIELLKAAPITTKTIPVIFKHPNQLYMFTASPNRADDILALLKRAGMPGAVLIRWDNAEFMLTSVVKYVDQWIHPGDCATIVGADGATIRIKDRDVRSASIEQLMNDSHVVTQLDITIMQPADGKKDELEAVHTFTMNDKTIFKGLKYPKPAPEDDDSQIFWSYALLAAAKADEIMAAMRIYRESDMPNNDDI